MAEAWTQWEGRTVNGIYPLRRFLSASDHSSVFLTESSTEGFLNAAIKLVPADPAVADLQLWHWKTATTFTHPNLVRLLDSGQCEIDGQQLLFVVMEYAEESLAQVLPYRALGPDEVRELLVPTLDALAFLHRENWIQGQLRPSNFLVVNDQLKLATDTIRPVGVTPEKVTHPTLYDAPEAESGDISFATDVWGLGVTLVEALTQYAPSWPGGHAEPPALPSNLPASFAELIQRCLSVNPSDRPTIPELQEKTKPAAPEPVPQTVAPSATSAVMTPEQARQEIAGRTSRPSAAGAAAPTGEEVIRADSGFAQPITPSYAVEPEPQRRGPTRMIVAAIVVLVVVWGGWRWFHHGASPMADTPGAAASPGETASPSGATDATGAQGSSEPNAAPPRGAPQPTSPGTQTNSPAGNARVAPGRKSTGATGDSAADGSIVHQEIPNVSQSSRQTIHGHIKVAVKVTVDRSGNVVRDALESGSSSKYFNRVASEAARKWRFAAADGEGSRQWLLHFEFGRDGTAVRASRSGS